jgi:hypothetical protein
MDAINPTSEDKPIKTKKITRDEAQHNIKTTIKNCTKLFEKKEKTDKNRSTGTSKE